MLICLIWSGWFEGLEDPVETYFGCKYSVYVIRFWVGSLKEEGWNLRKGKG